MLFEGYVFMNCPGKVQVKADETITIQEPNEINKVFTTSASAIFMSVHLSVKNVFLLDIATD